MLEKNLVIKWSLWHSWVSFWEVGYFTEHTDHWCGYGIERVEGKTLHSMQFWNFTSTLPGRHCSLEQHSDIHM